MVKKGKNIVKSMEIGIFLKLYFILVLNGRCRN